MSNLASFVKSGNGGIAKIPSQTHIGNIFIRDQHYPADNPLILDGGTGAVLDGDYNYPAGRVAVTRLPNGVLQHTDKPFLNHDGDEFTPLGYVWSGLIHLKNCSNIYIVDLDITRSRGGGLVIEGCKNIKYIGGSITHNRHAAIRVIRSHDVELAPKLVHENANFAPTSRSSKSMNWPMIVNVTHGSTNVVVRNAWIWGNWGEGIGSGQRIENLAWSNLLIGPNLAMGAYMHEGEQVTMKDCVLYHDESDTYNRGSTPSALLVVNREVDIALGNSDQHMIDNCLFLPRSDSVAIDIWGNQGREGKTGKLTITNNVAISKAGSLLKSFGNVAGIHTDTLIAENTFVRLDGGDCYDDRTDGKKPIDGPTVKFENNTWSKLPPKSMRGKGATLGIPQFVNPIVAEDIPAGGKPSRGDYVTVESATSEPSKKAPIEIDAIETRLARVEKALAEMGEILGELTL